MLMDDNETNEGEVDIEEIVQDVDEPLVWCRFDIIFPPMRHLKGEKGESNMICRIGGYGQKALKDV